MRIQAVPGAGVINPAVMFIGEGPGAEEDKTGIPFVGRAGQYLDKWGKRYRTEQRGQLFHRQYNQMQTARKQGPLPRRDSRL